MALYLGQRGQKPEASAGLVVARAAKGALLEGVEVEAVDVSATVQAIDRPDRAVTLQGPDGKLVTTKVDKSVKAFATLKVGDSVHARYTEAVAISVEKPWVLRFRIGGVISSQEELYVFGTNTFSAGKRTSEVFCVHRPWGG